MINLIGKFIKFWKAKKVHFDTSSQQPVSKEDVLLGMKQICAYFERHTQSDTSFIPEFETSKLVNSIVERREVLTQTDVDQILNLMDDINKTEHYNGSGWFDYKLRLTHFLKLSGLESHLFD